MRLRVPTIKALIKAKEAMHRPRDSETIRQIKAIKTLKSSDQDPHERQ
jgi:hypothetical protein